MTIKRLKEMIADLPDDMRIYADDSSYSLFGNDASEFCCIAASPQFPKMCILQSKSDIDVGEELYGMAEYAEEENWEEQDFFIEAYERGFKPEDFDDPEWAEKQYENYGLN